MSYKNCSCLSRPQNFCFKIVSQKFYLVHEYIRYFSFAQKLITGIPHLKKMTTYQLFFYFLFELFLGTCPILSRITNGMLMPELCSGPDNPIEGTTCSVACMKNFDKRGIGSATCLSTGRWSSKDYLLFFKIFKGLIQKSGSILAD